MFNYAHNITVINRKYFIIYQFSHQVLIPNFKLSQSEYYVELFLQQSKKDKTAMLPRVIICYAHLSLLELWARLMLNKWGKHVASNASWWLVHTKSGCRASNKLSRDAKHRGSVLTDNQHLQTKDTGYLEFFPYSTSNMK